MASETTFDIWKVVFLMRKSEKKGPNSKRACCLIFKLFVVTCEVISPKMAPILDPVIFFLGFQPYKSLCKRCCTAIWGKAGGRSSPSSRSTLRLTGMRSLEERSTKYSCDHTICLKGEWCVLFYLYLL